MVFTKCKILVDGSKYVDNIFSVSWTEPNLSLSDIPTFEFDTDNFNGRNVNVHNIGKDVKIYRNGEVVFLGTVEPKSYRKGQGGNTVKVGGKHKGYVNLQKKTCEGYRNEYGYVNPWQWGRKLADGSEVDGINPADVFRNIIGVKFTWQEFLDNAKYFITGNDASGTPGFVGLTVYDDLGLGNPKLMARSSGDSFILGSGASPGVAHSVALRNGPFIRKSFVSKNLALKSSSEDEDSLDTSVWTITGVGESGTPSVTTSDAYEGERSLYFFRNTTGSSSCEQLVSGIVAGETYTISVYAKMNNVVQGTQGYHKAYVINRWIDASGNQLSGFPDLSIGTGTADWNRYTTTVVAPSGAVKLKIRPGLQVCTGELWVDNVQVEKSSSATSYEDPRPRKVRGMGDIQSVSFQIYGDKHHANDPIVAVCRDGNKAIGDRTYVTGTLQIASGSPNSGQGVSWVGSVTFSGLETKREAFAYKIYPNGLATGTSSSTNRIDYMRFDCDTTTDTQLLEGIIHNYVDTVLDSGNNIVVNLLGMNRLEAAEKVRKMTLTSDDIEDSPHWDAWIDNALKFHFVEKRGTKKEKLYSFANLNVTNLEHSFDANNLVNQVIAKGQGTPPNQLTIQSHGDLIDLESIDKYGLREGVFQDSNIKDATTLFRRAKAYLKLYKDPVKTLSLTLTTEWDKPWSVGDSIRVQDSDVDVNGYWRIIGTKHTIRGEGVEKIDVELGNKSFKARDLLRGISSSIKDQEIIYQGTQSSSVTSSLSIPFDKDRPAVYHFVIPEGVDVEAVYLYAKTDVFKGTTKSADSSPATTSTSDASSSATTATTDINHIHNTFTKFSSTPYEASDLDFYEYWEGGNASRIFLAVPNGVSAPQTLTTSNPTTAISHGHGMEHTHEVTLPSHTHNLVFGIYEFEGDDGLFGGPMYPTKIRMYIDKLPGEAGAIAYEPWGDVGKTSGSVTVNKLDITEGLRDVNGKIPPGIHFISFKPSDIETNNVQNLGQIAVNHFIKFNTTGEQE